ncbi:hypothetical protein ASE61_11860 [Bosea sp. Root670]|nr:hypothetical protein ASE61_11860 [Bosea sp. Root670]
MCEGISTSDADLNELEFVLATETPGLTYRGNQLVDEVRSMAGLANFTEAPNWPLLRDHDCNTESVVGHVISARIEGDQLVCRPSLPSKDV